MRGLNVVLVALVGASLAGCVSTSDPPAAAEEPPGTEPAGVMHPWALTDCRFLNAFPAADAAALSAQLPEGFSLDGSPYIGIEAFDCASGTGLDGSVIEGMQYGSYFTSVTPPSDLTIPGVDTYYYKWWVLVPDSARAAAFADRGMAVEAGDAEVHAVLPVPAAAYAAVLHPDGIGHHELRMVSAQSSGGSEGEPFGEFSPLDGGGHARWLADYTIDWIDSGVGVVEVPAGSMAAEVMGATTVEAPMITGQWSFHDGWVRFPANETA